MSGMGGSKSSRVRLGVETPDDVEIYREEIYEQIKEPRIE
jgi:carbon storage regulator CsrA